MNNRLIGGILLIVGTSIGGGMLAIPMATAGLGFWVSSLMLIGIWLLMTFSAYLLLEVNLALPEGSNLISMARATLGRPGEIFMWLTYLLLLYALLSAFTAGGADIIYNFTQTFHLILRDWLNALIFLILFGSIVLIGIHGVDFANRILLSTKLLSFLLVAAFCLPSIHFNSLGGSALSYLKTAVMPVVTSFGFAIIMPSLRIYLESNVRRLRQSIFYGSLIPLSCYLLWNFIVQGMIAHSALIQFGNSDHAVAALTDQLSSLAQHSFISELTHLFTIICISTSFLGVSLCLIDFLRDGLGLKKTGIHPYFWPTALAFIPPFILVSLAPNIFIKALSYAGVACVVLLMLFPGLMAYRSRYALNVSHTYQVMGGKTLLSLQILASFLMLAFALWLV